MNFLHDLGSIQYFQNEYLKKMVVINPQWIVNVMSCIITVKDNVFVVGPEIHIYAKFCRLPNINFTGWKINA